MSKLFGVETSFTKNRGRARAGVIQQQSYGIVTGVHAVESHYDGTTQHAMPRVGRAVYLNEFIPADGVGTVSILDNPSDQPYGVLAMSHVYSPTGEYNDGDAANVITFGRVFMICSSNMEYEKIKFGRPVGIVRDWGSVSNIDNSKFPPINLIRTRWYFTGQFEMNVPDIRFGSVNVAEVMVVGGGVVTQGEAGVVPKFYGHKQVSDAEWYGERANYLLPPENDGSNKTPFEAFVNTVAMAKEYMAQQGIDPESVEITEIKNTGAKHIRDYTKPLDARADRDMSKLPANGIADISDGIGKIVFKFSTQRESVGLKESSWCSNNYEFTVKYKKGEEAEKEIEFKVPFLITYEM